LPAIYALSKAEGGARDELRELYGKPVLDGDGVQRVIHLLEHAGSREYCARLMQERSESALAEFRQLDLKASAATEMREAAEFILEREL
jgi:geranylgeranyl pyrophosphate synthase